MFEAVVFTHTHTHTNTHTQTCDCVQSNSMHLPKMAIRGTLIGGQMLTNVIAIHFLLCCVFVWCVMTITMGL